MPTLHRTTTCQPPLEVRPWLLLGGAHHACDLPLLRRLGIGYVMNVAWNVRNFHEDQPGLTYKNLRVKDYGYDEGISRVFEEAASFGKQVKERYEGGRGSISGRDDNKGMGMSHMVVLK